MNYINNKNKICKVIFSLIGFILMLSGISYAYFVSKINNNESASTIAGEAANLELEFKEGSNQINGDDIFPGWSDTKTFTVKNKSSIDVYYNLYISDIKNELMSESISYKIESTDGGYNLEKVLLPSTDGIIKTGIYIKGNASHTYTITTYYNNLDIDQSSEKGKTFSFKIYIKSGYMSEKLYTFAFTGSEQTFTAPYDGTYKLETWGAQGHGWSGGCGSSSGGAGGYSSGYVYLNKGKKLYLNIGGNGENQNVYGTGAGPGGGGATSISFISGKLQTLENSINSILIVSGGGGGSEWCESDGGSGGGYKGGTAVNLYIPEGLIYGGTQSSGGASAPIYQYSGTTNIYNGSFGQGGYTIGGDGGGQGGNGFYGGGASDYGYGGGGGSCYIGNSLLTNKVMYCYNCTESSDESTKTISTTCINQTPTENCAKQGSGYAKITFVSPN